ncbi:MAG: zinc ribbon domain-containing protein [Candidatus Hodarchaeota archaeon]
MNYCPNCGIKIESFWNVCANCGYVFSEDRVSMILQSNIEKKQYPISIAASEPVKKIPPKISGDYFEPQKTYGTVALIAGIICLGLSLVIMVLKMIGPSMSSLIIFNNVMILILSCLAIISGILGIVKDDSKGLGITGLILGIGGLVILYIRFIFFILRIFIPFPL